MEASDIHWCEYTACQQETAHSDQERHRRINLFVSRLDEQQRRWYVAMESGRLGPDGDEVLSHIMGMDAKTIQRGRQEMESHRAPSVTSCATLFALARLWEKRCHLHNNDSRSVKDLWPRNY